MFYHLSFHFLKGPNLLGGKSFIRDKVTLDCHLESLVICYREMQQSSPLHGWVGLSFRL